MAGWVTKSADAGLVYDIATPRDVNYTDWNQAKSMLDVLGVESCYPLSCSASAVLRRGGEKRNKAQSKIAIAKWQQNRNKWRDSHLSQGEKVGRKTMNAAAEKYYQQKWGTLDCELKAQIKLGYPCWTR